MTDDVLSKEETRKAIMAVMAAVLRGDPAPPDPFANKKYMRREDVEAVTDEINQMMASRFDRLPEQVSDDLNVQEIIRQSLDQVMVDHVALIKCKIDQLKGSKEGDG